MSGPSAAIGAVRLAVPIHATSSSTPAMPTCTTTTEHTDLLFVALRISPELVEGLIYLTLSKLSRNEDVLIINRAFQIHNPQFNYPEFGLIELESGVNRIFMSVGQFNSKIG